jgi:acetyltransferase-like isoleucine patch superfamily enzyme
MNRDFAYTTANGNVTITGYKGNEKEVVIPAEINNLPVTAIGVEAFHWYPAFGDDLYLTGVTIPNSVTFIGDMAFAGNRLTGVTIPSGVTSIGPRAFAGNSMLKELLCAPDNPAYTSVDGVLFSKDRETLVTYPGGKGSIYSIPESVVSIGPYAFSDNKLTDVTIPAGVISIGQGAFAGNRLTSVIIPNNVTTIGTGAFAGNSMLKELLCAPDNPAYASVDGVLFSKNQETLVVYPEGKGNTYTLPASVTAVGKNAFAGNQLISITIGANIEIPDNAFYGNFASVYNSAGKLAGQYIRTNYLWQRAGH